MAGDILLALQFLTRLPVPARSAADPRALARSAAFFPLAGAVIGLIIVAAYAVAARFWGDLPAAGFALLAWVSVTGGLHLDGLADMADGLLSGRDRARMLEIMRDSRIGAMGATAVVVLLLLKFSLVAGLPPQAGGGVLFLAPVAGRLAAVVAMYGARYAREGEGMGRGFLEHLGRRELLLAVGLAVAIAAAAGGYRGAAVTAVAVLVTAVFRRWVEGKLGGLTGDTLGAAIELAETVALAAALI